MAEPFIYRILKSSWGIWISIDCEVVALSDATGENLIEASDFLSISVDEISFKPTEEDVQYILLGVRLVEDTLRAKFETSPVVLRPTHLQIAWTDYQPEGLAYAIAGWLNREYELGWEPEEVQFNKAENRYVFPF